MPTRLASSANRLASRRSAGFTLVELVTVILILGVLAAVALPRYADLQGKARASKVQAFAGTIQAASAIVKATALTSGVSCGTATAATVVLEGLTIALNHCYPQALNTFGAGILGASNITSDQGWSTPTGGGSAPDSQLVLSLADATTPATCAITYTSAADATTPPVITSDTTGC